LAEPGQVELFINSNRAYFRTRAKDVTIFSTPKDGLPPEECQSVTIVCKEGMVANALTTAALVLGPEKGYSLCKKLEGVGCLIIEKEGKIILSPGLRGRISFNRFR